MVPVPLHWRRQWWRGFNQSQLLCRALRAACPELAALPIAARAISRKRATAAQSGMNARQRARNLQGAFTVHEPCDNLRVAVVDDVLTTGATAAAWPGHCVRRGPAILKSGAWRAPRHPRIEASLQEHPRCATSCCYCYCYRPLCGRARPSGWPWQPISGTPWKQSTPV